MATTVAIGTLNGPLYVSQYTSLDGRPEVEVDVPLGVARLTTAQADHLIDTLTAARDRRLIAFRPAPTLF